MRTKDIFNEWAKKNVNGKIFNQLSEVMLNPSKELSAGQCCTFTNEYGIQFKNLTIMGFCQPEASNNNRCVYLDKESYWFPVSPNSITLSYENKPVRLDTALMLAENGFYERCEAFYSRDLQIYYRNNPNHKVAEIMVECPTLFRAIQWLKEKYEVLIEVSWHYTDSTTQNYTAFICYVDSRESISDMGKQTFDTFEQALEMGLQGFLELLY